MVNNINQSICFPNEDTISKISDILKNNGIEETSIDAVFKEETSFISMLLNKAKNFASHQISDKVFILDLEKELKISIQVAEKIFNEVKEKIIPFAEIIDESPSTPINGSTQANKKRLAKAPIKNQKKINASTNISPQKNNKDLYREPIE